MSCYNFYKVINLKKNKIVTIILVLIIIIQFIWIICSEFTNPNWNNIDIFIKEDTLTCKGATFVIKNKNFISVDCLIDDYYIYKKVFDRWEKLPDLTKIDISNPRTSSPSILYSYNHNINWENKYGTLESGTYRIDFKFYHSNKRNVSSNITISLQFVLK